MSVRLLLVLVLFLHLPDPNFGYRQPPTYLQRHKGDYRRNVVIEINFRESAARLYHQEVSQKHVMKRITHGHVTSVLEHPHQVALLDRGNKHILCGGALIAPKVALTAAHCTHAGNMAPRKDLTVLVGADYLGDPLGEIHKIQKIVKHPGFDYHKFDKDIAVVVLERPVSVGMRAVPIGISLRDYKAGTKGTISGWGLTEFGTPPKELRAATAVIENHSKCQRYFPRILNPLITENMVCVKPSPMSSHYGDSGGPLTVDGKLVGLVSFGRPLTPSGQNKVTVFTKVKGFVGFINEVVPLF